MSETYPGQMLPELQEKTTVDSNDLFYMVSSNASKKIKGSNLKAQMKPSDYTGATSSTNGANGLVPQPTTSDVDRFLKGDGTWGDISYAVGEVSGSIATFSDGSPLPMRTLKAYIEPQQDLHGYDIPWVGGVGKNKLPMTVASVKELNGGSSSWSGNSKVINDVTFTIQTDADNNVIGIKANGTASSQTNFYTINGTTLSTGTYILSGCPSGGSTTTYMLYNQVTGNSDYGEGSQFTISDGSQNQAIRIVIRSGYNAQNLVFTPMIRLSSVTDSTFAPYSNECPISGWDEANVTRCGKNLFDISTASNGYIDASGNVVELANIKASDFIKVIPNEAYTISYYRNKTLPSGMRLAWYDENKNFIRRDGIIEDASIGEKSTSATCPSNGRYLRVSMAYDNILINKNQLEKGSIATEYEAYNGQTYTVEFKDGSNPLTVYGGTLDVVSGVMTVDKKFIDVSSMASSVGYNSGVGAGTLASTGLKPNITSETINEYISNCLKAHINSGVASMNYEFTVDANSGILFKVPNCSSASDYQTWVTNNNLQIVGKLATPQNIQLTPTQVKSLLGENRVWADTGDVDVHYVRDLTITIDDILSRLEALEG